MTEAGKRLLGMMGTVSANPEPLIAVIEAEAGDPSPIPAAIVAIEREAVAAYAERVKAAVLGLVAGRTVNRFLVDRAHVLAAIEAAEPEAGDA